MQNTVLKGNILAKEAPHRKYYMTSNDTKTFQINNKGHLSQGLLGLCCSIETRDHIEIITRTAVLFE